MDPVLFPSEKGGKGHGAGEYPLEERKKEKGRRGKNSKK